MLLEYVCYWSTYVIGVHMLFEYMILEYVCYLSTCVICDRIKEKRPYRRFGQN